MILCKESFDIYEFGCDASGNWDEVRFFDCSDARTLTMIKNTGGLQTFTDCKLLLQMVSNYSPCYFAAANHETSPVNEDIDKLKTELEAFFARNEFDQILERKKEVAALLNGSSKNGSTSETLRGIEEGMGDIQMFRGRLSKELYKLKVRNETVIKRIRDFMSNNEVSADEGERSDYAQFGICL